MKRALTALLATACLTACGSTVQTTSASQDGLVRGGDGLSTTVDSSGDVPGASPPSGTGADGGQPGAAGAAGAEGGGTSMAGSGTGAAAGGA